MKKILITGAESYIGTYFENYIISNFSDKYEVDTVDMRYASWREKDFSPYDCVYHVAGIAHQDGGTVSQKKENLYRSVNTELAIETAKKAKAQGVKQFIFMSSAIVYGKSAPIGREKMITKETKPEPENFYGDSKLQAENGIKALEDETFKVVILRPPMIYGKNCKGNFCVLEKIALKSPFFPKVNNKRSNLYVGNLVEFVRLMIENEESGTFFPQNPDFSCTSETVKKIAQAYGRKIWLIPGVTWLLSLLSHFTTLVNRAFGGLYYDASMSEYKEPYQLYDMTESLNDIKKKIF